VVRRGCYYVVRDKVHATWAAHLPCQMYVRATLLAYQTSSGVQNRRRCRRRNPLRRHALAMQMNGRWGARRRPISSEAPASRPATQAVWTDGAALWPAAGAYSFWNALDCEQRDWRVISSCSSSTRSCALPLISNVLQCYRRRFDVLNVTRRGRHCVVTWWVVLYAKRRKRNVY